MLDRNEVCTLLNVHRDTLRRWESSGRLQGFVLSGKCVRYRRADLEALLEEARHARHEKRGPKPKRPSNPYLQSLT
jgi:excisionase family DNA binding protein